MAIVAFEERPEKSAALNNNEKTKPVVRWSLSNALRKDFRKSLSQFFTSNKSQSDNMSGLLAEYEKQEDQINTPEPTPAVTRPTYATRQTSLSYNRIACHGIVFDNRVRFTFASSEKVNTKRPLLHLLLIKQEFRNMHVDELLHSRSMSESGMKDKFVREARKCRITLSAYVRAKQF
jgi:hypothetical protein